MSSRLVPSNPEEVMVIRQVTPEITTLSVPFKRWGLINVGGRGTIVRLRTGSLAIFSPVALTPTVKSTLSSLGTVKYLIAPDTEHHIFLDDWHTAYPDTHIIAPEGLPEKRASSSSLKTLPFGTIFTARAKHGLHVTDEFDAEFDYEFVDAHPNKELVFCHKPTRTLIEADLLFNLPPNEQMSRAGQSATAGWLTRFFTALNGTSGSAIWQKRFIWYGISVRDRSGFNRSVKRIDGWDFDRIVPCHGDVIETGGKGVFRKVMEWHLDAARKAA